VCIRRNLEFEGQVKIVVPFIKEMQIFCKTLDISALTSRHPHSTNENRGRFTFISRDIKRYITCSQESFIKITTAPDAVICPLTLSCLYER